MKTINDVETEDQLMCWRFYVRVVSNPNKSGIASNIRKCQIDIYVSIITITFIAAHIITICCHQKHVTYKIAHKAAAFLKQLYLPANPYGKLS